MDLGILHNPDGNSFLTLALGALLLDIILLPAIWWFMHKKFRGFWQNYGSQKRQFILFLLLELLLVVFLMLVLGIFTGLFVIVLFPALIVHVLPLFNAIYGFYQYQENKNKWFLGLALLSLAYVVIYPFDMGLIKFN